MSDLKESRSGTWKTNIVGKAEQQMKMEINRKENELLIGLSGSLDTETAPQLQEQFDDIEKIESIHLEFANLEYVSSAGLRVLLNVAKQMKKKDGKLVLHNVNSDIMDVFIITGFSNILTIE